MFKGPNVMSPDADTDLDSWLARFNVSRESKTRLMLLHDLLEKWQGHINLIGPSTVKDIWTRHILDALQLLAFLPPRTQAIADLGSGGGFPGLVLAATQPATVHMFESNGKKIAFLQEALRQMNVPGRAHKLRLGPSLQSGALPEVQVVTARAFAPLSNLLRMAQPFFGPETIGLFHKGQDVDAELTEAAKAWRIRFKKHPSLTDSKSNILEVEEFSHV
jgi:16S rRNA (guanine527-N7)-methyltransferase